MAEQRTEIEIFADDFIKICDRLGFTLKQVLMVVKFCHNRERIDITELREPIKELERSYFKDNKRNINYKKVVVRVNYHINNPYKTAHLRTD